MIQHNFGIISWDNKSTGSVWNSSVDSGVRESYNHNNKIRDPRLQNLIDKAKERESKGIRLQKVIDQTKCIGQFEAKEVTKIRDPRLQNLIDKAESKGITIDGKCQQCGEQAWKNPIKKSPFHFYETECPAKNPDCIFQKKAHIDNAICNICQTKGHIANACKLHKNRFTPYQLWKAYK